MLIEKLKTLNDRLTEATKDITFKSWFPLILYILTYFLIDFFMFYAVLNNVYVPAEVYFQRVVFSNIIALSSLVFMFGKKTSAIVYAASSVFMLVYGFAQMCYSSANKTLFRITAVFSAKEGAKFAAGITKGISNSILVRFLLLLLLVAAVTFAVLKFSRSPEKGVARKFKYIVNSVIFLGSGLIVALLPVIKSSGALENYGSYQAYNYEKFVNGVDVYKDMDLMMYLQRDIICTVRQSVFVDNDTGKIDAFFEDKSEHTDNDKTALFEGKNLIVVQMESLDYNGIDEESCPNISRLMKESINFENFYSSRFGDTFTLGTEIAVNAGLFAPAGVSLSVDFEENSFPYTLAALFREQGYSANEFHYNEPDYYNRGVMSATLGYENYIRYEDYAEDKAQNFEIDDTVVTDDGIYKKLTENDKFLDYIVTYSAHTPYTADDELYLEAIKRHPELAAEDENDKAAIFRAKASLTDDMVGELVRRLEEDGELDNTVILFLADHYCSGILSGDYSDALCSNTPCFIYAKGTEPETVEKVCNTCDILPTLVNLFGLGDCENYIGSDIFDDAYEGYACFQNLGWITSDFYYENGDIVENYTGRQADDSFIEQMNELVKERININNQILFTDYYAKDKK